MFNEGVVGDTAYAIQNRLDKSLYDYQPDIVILGAGTNDINSNWMIWPGKIYVGKSANNIEEYSSIMRDIFSDIRFRLPNAHVLILGMSTPVTAQWKETSFGFTIKYPEQSVIDQYFSAYNKVLSELSSEFKFEFLDVATWWERSNFERQALLADGIHANDAGYEIMAENIFQQLNALLNEVK